MSRVFVTLAIMPLLMATCGFAASPDYVVNIANADITVQTAVLFCQGMYNRKPSISSGGVYTLMSWEDQAWLTRTNTSAPNATSIPDFFSTCFSWPRITGFVSYNLSAQKAVFPMIMTAASSLGAVPIDVSSGIDTGSLAMKLNASAFFKDLTPAEAVSLIHTEFVSNTTGMAMMAVGYDQHTKKHGSWDPPLTGNPVIGILDYVVARQLFCMYLYDACIPLTQDYKVMTHVLEKNPWPKPIAVFGYNNAWAVSGDLFEAETDCTKEHNMGQVASDGCNGLSYFALEGPVTKPVTQSPTLPSNNGQGSAAGTPKYIYNSSKTYVSLLIGDGDNLNYLKGSRSSWMLERLAKCLTYQNSSGTKTCSGPCFPLVWSLSPHTFQVAPAWLDWFLNQAKKTGCDWFALPPSGALYAYPAMMPTSNVSSKILSSPSREYSPKWSDEERLAEIAALQATGDVRRSFVRMTERAAWLLNTSTTTEWEWFTDWGTAISEYYPLYKERSIVTGFVTVNVPFLFPVFQFDNKQYILYENSTRPDGDLAVFAPREWRGSQNTTDPLSKPMLLSPKELSAEINSAASLGSVRSIYITSDGGANLDLIYSLVALLEDHVEVVDHEAIVAMARLRGRK